MVPVLMGEERELERLFLKLTFYQVRTLLSKLLLAGVGLPASDYPDDEGTGTGVGTQVSSTCRYTPGLR